MNNSWEQLKLWLKDNVNLIYKDLNSGADQKMIITLEESIGAKLPESFKNYLQNNDGQFGRTGPVLMQDWELMKIEYIIKTWKMHSKIFNEENYEREDQTQKTQPFWWDSYWVPFAYNGAGDHLCLDLNPGPKGSKGQIITFWHTNSFREVIARSWDELIENFLSDLREGEYIYQDDEIIKKLNKSL